MMQRTETKINTKHKAVDQRLLYGFGDEETLIENSDGSQGNVREHDDAPLHTITACPWKPFISP